MPSSEYALLPFPKKDEYHYALLPMRRSDNLFLAKSSR